MGCDIHAVIERKFDDGWHVVAELNGFCDRRDYEFFTHLCGVRNYNGDDENWPQPKGVPDDASTVTKWKVEGWGVDGHSHSWDTAKDFVDKKLAIARIRGDNDTDASYEWYAYKALGYSCDDQENDYSCETDQDRCFNDLYRVVYWFDN